MEKMKIRIILTEEALGTAPNDPDVYSTYIAGKAPTMAAVAQELSALDRPEGLDEKGLTVFGRSSDGEAPIFWDYQIRGFFKDACSMLSRSAGKDAATGKKRVTNKSSALKSYKKVIDGNIFVLPRQIRIKFSGEMGLCQRPLRAETMQGPRTALAASETVPAGSSMDMTIITADRAMMDTVEEWLDYGILRGLGQWRNSGKGKFRWVELDKDGQPIPGSGNLHLSEMDAIDRVAL